MKKIITHDGLFHADEIFAIALLLETLGEVPIERTRNISIEDFNDPEVWILDVAQDYNRFKHNFDHHQDVNAPATNMLILKELYDANLITQAFYKELEQSFIPISNIDTQGYGSYNGFQVNSLIKSFNALTEGFTLSLDIARLHIKIAKKNVATATKSLELWNAGVVEKGLYRICDEYPIKWRNYNEENFVIILHKVTPENMYDAPEYTLHSSNNSKFPIRGGYKETFLHNNRFIAKYNTLEDAINAANASGIVPDNA